MRAIGRLIRYQCMTLLSLDFTPAIDLGLLGAHDRHYPTLENGTPDLYMFDFGLIHLIRVLLQNCEVGFFADRNAADFRFHTGDPGSINGDGL